MLVRAIQLPVKPTKSTTELYCCYLKKATAEKARQQWKRANGKRTVPPPPHRTSSFSYATGEWSSSSSSALHHRLQSSQFDRARIWVHRYISRALCNSTYRETRKTTCVQLGSISEPMFPHTRAEGRTQSKWRLWEISRRFISIDAALRYVVGVFWRSLRRRENQLRKSSEGGGVCHLVCFTVVLQSLCSIFYFVL